MERIMDDNKYNFFRVASAIVLTPTNLNAIDRQDMLDSILLAQLVANKRHNPYIDTDKWAQVGIKSLSNTHWALTSSKNTATTLIEPFSAGSALSRAQPLQEFDLAKAVPRLPHQTSLDLMHACTQTLEGLTHYKLTIIKAEERGQFHLRSLLFASPSIPKSDWLDQQHYASRSNPAPTRLYDLSFSLTADYKDIRNKVTALLGHQREREIQAIHLITND